MMSAISDSATVALARRPHRIAPLMNRLIPEIVSVSATAFGEAAFEAAEEWVCYEREQERGFRERLRDRWGVALDRLKLLRLWCLTSGMEYHDRHKPAAGDWSYAALVRLHARSCLVAADVIALLEAGHASGAHARWRSAHEIAVVALLVAEHGQALAERYVEHSAVDAYRSLADYQLYAPRLGYAPFDEEEVDEIRRRHSELIDRFGASYRHDYGWAADVIGKERPTFRDLETAASLDHLRPYYRMASRPNHAGPRALEVDLGLLEPGTLLLAGPSNAGLADPGHALAISLTHTASALLNHDPDIGDIVSLKVLLDMSDAVGAAFLGAAQRLRDNDAARS